MHGLLINKHIRIPFPPKNQGPSYPCTMTPLGGQGGYFQKSSKTSDINSEGLGEMFEGDSADTFAGKFLLMSMGGRAEGLACADPGAEIHILSLFFN